MSGLLKAIEARRARRALSDEPVAPEVLGRLLTAATYAPSCFNNQPWRFVMVTREPEIAAVKAGLGMAVGNLMLQATAEGLIAHPIAGYSPETIKQALGIPAELILIALVILGRPGEESSLNEKHLALEHSPRDRKPEAEVIHRGRW